MELMGRWNWWLPRPLARILPRAESEGSMPAGAEESPPAGTDRSQPAGAEA